MNKILIICITMLFISLQLSAQKKRDILYLKNGSIIHGKLIEVSDSLFKIQTSDGSLFVFSSQEVEKFIRGAQPNGPLNQEQLNLALRKANRKISTGQAFTIIGAITGVVGLILAPNQIHHMEEANDFPKMVMEVGLIGCGIGAMSTGIPNWIVGNNNKKKIELELVKIKSSGSASINGIGIKIRF